MDKQTIVLALLAAGFLLLEVIVLFAILIFSEDNIKCLTIITLFVIIGIWYSTLEVDSNGKVTSNWRK